MLHTYRIQPGIDYSKLPCQDRAIADGYEAKSLGDKVRSGPKVAQFLLG